MNTDKDSENTTQKKKSDLEDNNDTITLSDDSVNVEERNDFDFTHPKIAQTNPSSVELCSVSSSDINHKLPMNKYKKIKSDACDNFSCHQKLNISTISDLSEKYTNVELLPASNNKSKKLKKTIAYKKDKTHSKKLQRPKCDQSFVCDVGITLKDKPSCGTELVSHINKSNNDLIQCKKHTKKHHRTQMKNYYDKYALCNKGGYCDSQLKRDKKINKPKCFTNKCNVPSKKQNKIKKEICNDLPMKKTTDVSSPEKKIGKVSQSQIYEKSEEHFRKCDKSLNKQRKNLKFRIRNDFNRTDLKKSEFNENWDVLQFSEQHLKNKELFSVSCRQFADEEKEIHKVVNNSITCVSLSDDDDDDTDKNIPRANSKFSNKNYCSLSKTLSHTLNNSTSPEQKEAHVSSVTEKNRNKLQFKSDYYRMTNKELLSAGDYYFKNPSTIKYKKSHETVSSDFVRYGSLYNDFSRENEMEKILHVPILSETRIKKTNDSTMRKEILLTDNFFHVDIKCNKAISCDRRNVISTNTKRNNLGIGEPVACITLSDDENCITLNGSKDANSEINSSSDFNKRNFLTQKCHRDCFNNETKIKYPTLSDSCSRKDMKTKLYISEFLRDSNGIQSLNTSNSNSELKISPKLKHQKASEGILKLSDSKKGITLSDDSCDWKTMNNSPYSKLGKETHDTKSETTRKSCVKNISRCITLCSSDSSSDNANEKNDCEKFIKSKHLSTRKMNCFNDSCELLEPEEDPVDFPVPLLHAEESINLLSKEKMNDIHSKGIKVRRGQFTEKENTILTQNWQTIIAKYNLTDNPVYLLGIQNLKNGRKHRKVLNFIKAKHIYRRLALGLDDRTLSSVYKRARTLFHPARTLDKFTHAEISKIMKLQRDLGNSWVRIGEIIGRTPHSCLVAYQWWHKKAMQQGPWSLKESQCLKEAVKRVMEEDQLENTQVPGFWKKVSLLVVTRNLFQCRRHWLNICGWKVPSKERRKWNKQDYAKLVCILKKNIVDYEIDVNWESVSNSFVHCSPSYFYIQKRWYYLKSFVPKDAAVSHQKTVDYLYFTYIPQMLDKTGMQEFKSYEFVSA